MTILEQLVQANRIHNGYSPQPLPSTVGSPSLADIDTIVRDTLAQQDRTAAAARREPFDMATPAFPVSLNRSTMPERSPSTLGALPPTGISRTTGTASPSMATHVPRDVDDVIARITAEETETFDPIKNNPELAALKEKINNANAHTQALGKPGLPLRPDYFAHQRQNRIADERALTERMREKGLIPADNPRMPVDPERLQAAQDRLRDKGYFQGERGWAPPSGYDPERYQQARLMAERRAAESRRNEFENDPGYVAYKEAGNLPPASPEVTEAEMKFRNEAWRARREAELKQRRDLVRQRGILQGMARRGIMNMTPGQTLSYMGRGNAGIEAESDLARALLASRGENRRMDLASAASANQLQLDRDRFAADSQLANDRLGLDRDIAQMTNERAGAEAERAGASEQNQLAASILGTYAASNPTASPDQMRQYLESVGPLVGVNVPPQSTSQGGSAGPPAWMTSVQRSGDATADIATARELLKNAATGEISPEVVRERLGQLQLTPTQLKEIERDLVNRTTWFGTPEASARTLITGLMTGGAAPALNAAWSYGMFPEQDENQRKQLELLRGSGLLPQNSPSY